MTIQRSSKSSTWRGAMLGCAAIVLALVAQSHAMPAGAVAIAKADTVSHDQASPISAVSAAPSRNYDDGDLVPVLPKHLFGDAAAADAALLKELEHDLDDIDIGAALQLEEEHLRKRGFGGWIDTRIVGPLVDRTRPMVFHVVDIAVNETGGVIAEALPSGIQAAVREVLGIDALKPAAQRQCGWFQKLCDVLLPPIDNLIFKIRARVTATVTGKLLARKQAITDIVITTLKQKAYISEEGRKSLHLSKRGLRTWYVRQVNRVMQAVMANVRPRVRGEISKAITETVTSLPGWLRDTVNKVLPESMQLKPADDKLAKRGILDPIKNKLREWEQAVLNKITSIIESAVGSLEGGIMKVIIRTTQRLVAENLPFFDEKDAIFTPGEPLP